MHVTAVCPYCETSYQVKPSLRGQRMACPNALCRKVFTVPAELQVRASGADSLARSITTKPPQAGNQVSGSVGDLVPIVPVEPAAPADAPPAPPPTAHVSEVVPLAEAQQAEQTDWRTAPPPPRRTDQAPPAGSTDWWQQGTAAAPPPEAAPPSAAPASPPAPPAPTAPRDGDWWQQAPPQRATPTQQRPAAPPPPRPTQGIPTQRMRRPALPAAETQQMAAPVLPPPAGVPDGPRELPPGAWEPPPVRTEAAADPLHGTPNPAAFEHGSVTATEEIKPPQARLSRRLNYSLIAVLFLVVVGVLGPAAYVAYITLGKTQEQREAEAQKQYEESQFSKAAESFRSLAERSSEPDKQELYRFMAELADLRSSLHRPNIPPAEGLRELEDFLAAEKGSPHLREHIRELSQEVLRLADAFRDENLQPRGEEPLEVVKRFERLRTALAAVNPQAFSNEEKGHLETALEQVRVGVERWNRRNQVIVQLKAPEASTIESIHKVRRLLREKAEEFPELNKDPEVLAYLSGLYDQHLAGVRYEPPGAPPPARRSEDREPSLVFNPTVPGVSGRPAMRDEPIVLALVRGVLYALGQHSGAIHWALRVGIDTTSLPIRVPPSVAFTDERILVLSADTETLTALDTKGRQLWRYRLSQPCLGRPVVVDQRAYLPTYDGQVHEIELAEGRLLGRFQLGQRLTMGGTLEPGSTRIYFPADDSCVYILDVGPESHRCQGILYTNHPAGSLRSEPLVVVSENGPSYLILAQEHGLHETQLRVFPLAPGQPPNPNPLERDAQLVDLNPPARLSGWTWFQPHLDPEKVVVLSDAGKLGLFGIHQPGTNDQALFPLLQAGGINLDSFLLDGGRPPTGAGQGRAQIALVRGDDYWVLAHGLLRRLQMAWAPEQGPRLAPALEWQEALPVGSPQHLSQAFTDRQSGRLNLCLVTQKLAQHACLATTVDALNGRRLWQRQLGVVFQGEPLRLPAPDGGGSVLLVLDQSGALFTLEPRQFNTEYAWQSGGHLLKEGIDGLGRRAPLLLAAPDGKSAYELACPGGGMTLVVRHISWDEAGKLGVVESRVPLPAPLAGTPALVGDELVFPLADRQLTRLPLPIPRDNPACDEGGPSWRDRRSPADAPGYVLALDSERFLISDGGRGLTCMTWPKGRSWTTLPRERVGVPADAPTRQMKDRIAAPPALLPGGGGRGVRVAVADSAGALHVLKVGDDGSLEPSGKPWALGGVVSGGPHVFSLEGGKVRMGCVVEQTRLVWIDPEHDKPLWEYRARAALVGRPQRVGGQVLLASQDGRYIALDMETGKEQGAGYEIRGSMAPMACPVPFEGDRLLAPLSDGTAFLLSGDHFKAK